MRSSNSPRYLEPAISPGRSSVRILLSFIVSGTTPDAILCASPSTTAVFPTPGSPTRQGLFFVRRLNTCIRRYISFSRPITGSSFPSSARRVISVQNCSVIEPPFAPSWSSSWYSFGSMPEAFIISSKIFCRLILSVIRILAAAQSTSRIMARRRCSVPVSEQWSLAASPPLSSRIPSNRGLSFGFAPPRTSPAGAISSSIKCRTFSSSTPFLARICPATPLYSLRSPKSRCSVPTCGCFISLAVLTADRIAFSACFVYGKRINSSCNLFSFYS